MTRSKKPRAVPLVKTIRVSIGLHAKLQAFQYDGHHKSADAAIEALLAQSAELKKIKLGLGQASDVLDIFQGKLPQMPKDIDRIVREVRERGEHIESAGPMVKKEPASDYQPCGSCTTPNSCLIGGQDPEACE